jgi:phosphomannomutase
MTTSSPFPRIFKAYDVRGLVDSELTAETVFAVGAAFAGFAAAVEGASKVLVGRDMRSSGEVLAAAFSAGVLSEGLAVVDAGLASTDMLYFGSGSLSLPGAMLTASHNPADYNGIKMCLAGASPIGQDTGLSEIEERAESVLSRLAARPEELRPARNDPRVEQVDLLDGFARHVHGFVDLLSLRPLTVIADTANGMGGLVVPRVLGSLPFKLEILYAELDGTFPNHPADPIQEENLADLKERIVASRADVGIAFDGDADRAFLVDEETVPLSGSLTTSIVAAAMLDEHPGETVLYNLICSKAVPQVIEEHGGKAVRTRVGHSFIKAVMAETGAIFGGEHSGHYYFRDNYRADSGIIAALVVLSVLSSAGVPLSKLRKPYERYYDSGELNTRVSDAAGVLAGVERAYAPRAELDRLDGLTVDLGDWWFNLRASNTEPLLRLNLEASSAASLAQHTEEVRALVRQLDAEAVEGGRVPPR